MRTDRTKRIDDMAKQIVVAAKKKKKENKVVKPKRKNLLSTGSTLLNLACANNPFGGFLKGKYYFLVGDSTSGKTFLSMTCFAESTINTKFKNYRLIYDNVEDGMLMDVEHLFNQDVADRLEPPETDKEGNDNHSFTIEEFYYHLDDAIRESKKSGTPFIYVLDSMDGLSSEYEGEKFESHKKASREGKESPGSYGDGKAKKNSEGLRRVLKGIRETDSILIIISQTRDNIGGNGKTRGGGHALRFYSTVEIWTSIVQSLKKTVKGKEREIGVKVEARIKKNRITGEKHRVQMDIYYEYGIDDIGSCIDYLISEKWWDTEKKSIIAKEFNFTGMREKLIAHIENNSLASELRSIVGQCWKEIKEACSLRRKKKYGEDLEDADDVDSD